MLGYEISDVHAVSRCIKNALAIAKIDHQAAICAVPEAAVFRKSIFIDDDLSKQEIESQVFYEASKYLSYSVDDVSVDFKILGPSSIHPSMLEVWMVASPSEIVLQRVEALKLAHLKTIVVDVDAQAIQRTFRFLEAQSSAFSISWHSNPRDREAFKLDCHSLNTALGLALRGVK